MEVFLGPEEQRFLVERVVAGDRSAEDEFVRWFHPRIFAMLVARTADREASRDLAQDVLIAALKALRLGCVDEPERLSQFVHGVARNLAFNYIRVQSERRPRENCLPVRCEDRIAAPVRESESEIAAREEAIECALRNLDVNDRNILLWTMEGRKPRDIAESLCVSTDVVRQRKFRALQRIRDTIRKMSRKRSPHYVNGGRGQG